jgi:glycerophosphoryl diester phosphodiesterase
MDAFRRSLELGADGIELDVQRCASGELVVFHDEDIARTTKGVGLVRDCSMDELRKVSDDQVPLLQDVLDLIQGKLTINIELKNTPIEYPNIEEDMMYVIENYPAETLIISSFDHKLLAKVHALAPHLQIALLGDAVFLDLKQTATAVGATYFHPSYDCLRQDIVEEAHAANLKVNVWTCNTPREWRELTRMQVDGIITDDPEGLKKWISVRDLAETVSS